MADINTLSEESVLNEEEDEPKLYSHYDSNEEELNININYKLKNKNKYKTSLCLLFTALICLLLGIFTGCYLQKSFGFIGLENSNNASINNNEFNIMDQLHFRSKHKRGIRGNRSNEQECESRRCCDIRDGLTINDLPNGLNCTLLTDDECGDMDIYCQWDCDSIEYKIRKHQKFKRYFRRISLSQGSDISSSQILNNTQSNSNINSTESYQQCLDEAKIISSDDCGVEYDEEIDPELAQIFCQQSLNNNSTGHNIYDTIGNNTIDEGEENNDDGQRRLLTYERDLKPLGEDGRIHVTSTAFPFSAVMFVTFNNATGHTKRCTGTMISPRWVLTAAHCVWGDGDWYKDFKVYKDIRSCSDMIDSNEYSVNKKVVFTAYQTTRPTTTVNNGVDHDIGLLRLSVDPGIQSVDFGYKDFGSHDHFNWNQYPKDKPDCQLWRQYCTWDTIETNKFGSSTCDSGGGTSGSGMYLYYTSGERIIYGTHAGKAQDRVWGARITEGKYISICNYVEVETPGHCEFMNNHV